MDACQVTVSTGSEDEASRIATTLLEARLAACVQVVGPVTSRYWWSGTIETATEWLCLVKTRSSLVDPIVAAVRRVHSYDTPEVVATPIIAGDPAYLAWLAEESGPGSSA